MSEFKLDGAVVIEDLGEAGDFFAHLADVLAAKAKDLAIDDQLAEELAKQVVVQVATDFRGTQIHVTKKPLTMVKHLSIYNDMRRGLSPKHVAHKYDVSVQHVYAIYHRLQQKRLEKTQPKLL